VLINSPKQQRLGIMHNFIGNPVAQLAGLPVLQIRKKIIRLMGQCGSRNKN
jgi:hypothetical protein